MEDNQKFATFFSNASKGKKLGAIFSWIAAVVLIVALWVPGFRVKSLTSQVTDKVESVLGLDLSGFNQTEDEVTELLNGKKISVVSYLTKYDAALIKATDELAGVGTEETSSGSHMGMILLIVFFVLVLATVIFALFTMNILSLFTTLGAILEIVLIGILRFGAKTNAILTSTNSSFGTAKPAMQIVLIVLLVLAAVLQVVGVVLNYTMHSDEEDIGWDADGDDENRNMETGLLDDNETVAATGFAAPAMAASLIQMNTGKSFAIQNNSEMILGKGSQANLIISNPIISRAHAKIRCQNGTCTIQDLDSKNGTFVGDRKLSANEVVVLRDGTYITLGNEIFQFKM